MLDVTASLLHEGGLVPHLGHLVHLGQLGQGGAGLHGADDCEEEQQGQSCGQKSQFKTLKVL